MLRAGNLQRKPVCRGQGIYRGSLYAEGGESTEEACMLRAGNLQWKPVC